MNQNLLTLLLQLKRIKKEEEEEKDQNQDELNDDQDFDLSNLKLKEPSEIEKEVQKKLNETIEKLRPKAGWFWPDFIYSISNESLKEGVGAFLTNCPVLLNNYGLIPFPFHLVPPNESEEASNLFMKTRMIQMANQPLFGCFALPSTIVQCIMSGRPSDFPIVYYEQYEQDILETFQFEAERFEGSRVEFAESPRGRQLIDDYLRRGRTLKLEQKKQLSQFKFGTHHAFELSTTIVLYLFKILDYMALFSGFNDPDKKKPFIHDWEDNFKSAQLKLIEDIEHAQEEAINRSPEMKAALNRLHAQISKFGTVIDWNEDEIVDCITEGHLLTSIFTFTKAYIAAIERCILRCVRMEEQLIDAFVCTNQPLPPPSERYGGVDYNQLVSEANKMNDHLYHIRFNILSKTWVPLQANPLHNSVAMMGFFNPSIMTRSKRFHAEAKAIMMALARKTLPLARKTSSLVTCHKILRKKVDPRDFIQTSQSKEPLTIIEDYKSLPKSLFR